MLTLRGRYNTADVYTTTANASTLDEAPDAYKDYHKILEAITPTVDVVEMIKPVYNLKAGDEIRE